MKEFLREFFIEPFEDGWEGWFIGIILWLVVSVIVGLLAWLSIYLIDSSFLSKKEADGTITNKYIIPDHFVTTYVMSGKVMIPIVNHVPTSYHLDIQINKLSDDISVYETDYEQSSVGQVVHCTYTSGRIRNTIYIKTWETK